MYTLNEIEQQLHAIDTMVANLRHMSRALDKTLCNNYLSIHERTSDLSISIHKALLTVEGAKNVKKD
jgi:hypothetical protein